jgi:type IX secretion system PorP/SprF family membrane protein
MRSKIALILALSACFWLPSPGQNSTDYIQYMFNGLLLNPAYAGSHDALNATALYRKQWTGIAGAPVGIAVSAHTPLKNKSSNVGMIVESQHIGLYAQTRSLFAYAYRMRLWNGTLSFGLQAGAIARSYNWGMLEVKQEGDPVFSGAPNRNIGFSTGSGIYYQRSRLYFGVALPEMTSSEGPARSWQVHAGGLIKISPEFVLKPAVLVRTEDVTHTAVNLSATVYYKEIFGVGAGYTYLQNALLYMDLRVNEQLHAGYGFSRPVSDLSAYTPGSHEIMLRYLFRYRINSSNPRYF